MPNYVLNRTHTLRSTLGVVSFIKGEPAWVPPHMEREARQIGAECVDGENPDLLPPEDKAPEPLSIDERKTLLFLAFDQLVAKNEAKDFTGQGVPNVKAVEKIVDFSTDRGELNEMWSEYKLSKAEQ